MRVWRVLFEVSPEIRLDVIARADDKLGAYAMACNFIRTRCQGFGGNFSETMPMRAYTVVEMRDHYESELQ
jgi:hypothetical protein